MKSSQEAAREIATLRMKIFDLEMTGGGGGTSIGDPDEFDPVHASSNHSKLLIPYSNLMEEKSGHVSSRGSTASSNAYADLGGKVFGRSNKTPEPSSPLQPASEAVTDRHRMTVHEENYLGQRQRSREQVPASASAPISAPSYPPRSKPYMENAYRPNSTTGSPRPVSPSEASDMHSFAGSPRMPSKFPMVTARSRGGDAEIPRSLHTDGQAGSRRPSVPNSRQQSAINSKQHTSRSNLSNGGSPLHDASAPFYSDILETLARQSSGESLQTTKPPPLGDLSSLSQDSHKDVVDLATIGRKQSVNSIRSSRSAGSAHKSSNHHE